MPCVTHSNTRLFHSSECEGRAGEQRDRGICLELKGVERELKGRSLSYRQYLHRWGGYIRRDLNDIGGLRPEKWHWLTLGEEG